MRMRQEVSKLCQPAWLIRRAGPVGASLVAHACLRQSRHADALADGGPVLPWGGGLGGAQAPLLAIVRGLAVALTNHQRSHKRGGLHTNQAPVVASNENEGGSFPARPGLLRTDLPHTERSGALHS